MAVGSGGGGGLLHHRDQGQQDFRKGICVTGDDFMCGGGLTLHAGRQTQLGNPEKNS